MMECGMQSGMSAAAMACKVPLLLASLAIGYWVLTVASAQKKFLMIVGRIIGTGILLAALAGLLCGLCGSCKKKTMACSMDSAKAGCPMTKAMDSAAPADPKAK